MTEIEWKNTLNDQLPIDKQDVLISVNGIYYTAVYDRLNRKFVLKYEVGVFFPVENKSIYWKEISPPGCD